MGGLNSLAGPIRGKSTPIERVLARIEKDEQTCCWNFQGAKNESGYGIVGLGGRKDGVDRAHRISYRHFKGDIPKGMFVCHKCDNPSCCNPEHLFIGTAADNHKDMREKNRGSKPPRNEHDIGSYRYNAKLDENLVRQLRERNAAGETGYSLWQEVNKEFPITQAPFYRMLNGISWRHVNA